MSQIQTFVSVGDARQVPTMLIRAYSIAGLVIHILGEIVTLEQYAALAEIGGVVLVIASLVYVAKQLKQNNEMMRASASAQRVQSDTNLNFRVADSNEFAEIWLKGIGEFDSLSENEQIRLVFFNRAAIVHWHHMFSLRSQNMLPDSDWNEMTWLIRYIGDRQDLREAWKVFRSSFDTPFQTFLDAELEKA